MMHSERALSDLLGAYVAGDTTLQDRLRSAPQAELLRAAGNDRMVIGADVMRVLRGFRNGAIDSAAARTWASFVSRGFFSLGSVPTEAIDIEFEPAREDAIAEALMRLTELDDQVDGDLHPGEVDGLIASLE